MRGSTLDASATGCQGKSSPHPRPAPLQQAPQSKREAGTEAGGESPHNFVLLTQIVYAYEYKPVKSLQFLTIRRGLLRSIRAVNGDPRLERSRVANRLLDYPLFPGEPFRKGRHVVRHMQHRNTSAGAGCIVTPQPRNGVRCFCLRDGRTGSREPFVY